MAVSNERLVTEDLRSKFGAIELEVTQQDAARRIGCLRKADDKSVLAYHVVTFGKRGVAALGSLHDTIVSGKPIGETIKHSGVPHERIVSKPVASAMPGFLRALFRTHKKKCRMQIIEYSVKGKHYAHIEEYYNPEFTSLPHTAAVRA